MRLKRERISGLANSIVERLSQTQAIEPRGPKGELTAEVERIITEELMLEDRLDAEVRQILKTHVADMEKSQVDERKMFLMIKRQLAKERGVIL